MLTWVLLQLGEVMSSPMGADIKDGLQTLLFVELFIEVALILAALAFAISMYVDTKREV